MAVNKAKFKNVALKLRVKFDDFFEPYVFEIQGDYDPLTSSYTNGVTQTVDCLREEFQASQFDGQLIQNGDFKLLALYDDFQAIAPRTDGLKVTVGGKLCTVIKVSPDAANAMYTIHVRG